MYIIKRVAAAGSAIVSEDQTQLTQKFNVSFSTSQDTKNIQWIEDTDMPPVTVTMVIDENPVPVILAKANTDALAYINEKYNS